MASNPKTACVRMSGPEDPIDQRGKRFDAKPLNPLPVKCPHCTFPDLDFVAKPYLLGKGTQSPAEILPAMLGNFLVRERIKRIFEIAVPEACTFHPTAEARTKKLTPWWLAVPKHQFKTALPEPTPPLCPKCGESKDWHWEGDWEGGWPVVWSRMEAFDTGGIDVFKATGWDCAGTAEDDFEQRNFYRTGVGGERPPIPWSRMYPGVEPPTHAERWTRLRLDRELYFSVRLEQLLKRLKVKARLARIGFDGVVPTPEDNAWIKAKIQLLTEQGPLEPAATTGKSDTARRWFRQFLKRNAAKRAKEVDFAAVEQKHKLTLPQDYKDFIATVGSKSFENVEGMEETSTEVFVPHELDFKNHRRGRMTDLSEEDMEVDGVVFAEMDCGDCFVFDVSAKGDDNPVYWYRHEESILEPYAPNFAECIKRFAQKT